MSGVACSHANEPSFAQVVVVVMLLLCVVLGFSFSLGIEGSAIVRGRGKRIDVYSNRCCCCGCIVAVAVFIICAARWIETTTTTTFEMLLATMVVRGDSMIH